MAFGTPIGMSYGMPIGTSIWDAIWDSVLDAIRDAIWDAIQERHTGKFLFVTIHLFIWLKTSIPHANPTVIYEQFLYA